MSRSIKQAGVTLIELLTVVGVVGVLAAVATPSAQQLMERQRIKGAAELIRDQLMVARNEAVKRSRNITLSVAAKSDDPTAWFLGTTDVVNCDPTPDAGTSPPPCAIGGQPMQYSSLPFRDIELGVGNAAVTSGYVGGNTRFDYVRGTVGAGTFTGPFVLTSTNYELRVILSGLGRANLCSPAGTSKVPGYPDCA